MKELLLEIGTEEIPAGFIPKALSDLKELVQKEFEANRIDFKGIQTLGTPRRIVLYVESVSEKQRDEEIKTFESGFLRFQWQAHKGGDRFCKR